MSSYLEEDREAEAAIAELGLLYLADVPQLLQDLKRDFQQALQSAEAQLLLSAASRAHQIRGTAGSLGFQNLSGLAGELEERLSRLVLPVVDRAALDQIQDLMLRAEAAVGLELEVVRARTGAPAEPTG